MSEIEKLYKLAQVANIGYDAWDKKDMYPPFTADKQLELIKFLMKQEDFSWTIAQQGKDTKYVFYVGYEYGSGDFKEFTEAIAGIINNLWQDLTEEEKQQVKEILE